MLLIALPAAAIAGNLAGYWIGRKAGPAVFNKPNSRLFKAEYVDRSQRFFDRNGARTILLARFVPIVRTFATVMAGASRMDFRRYAVYSVIGGILWAGGLTLMGHWLGQVAVVRDHVELFVLGIVAVSLVPVVVEVVRGRRPSAPGPDALTGSTSDDPRRRLTRPDEVPVPIPD